MYIYIYLLFYLFGLYDAILSIHQFLSHFCLFHLNFNSNYSPQLIAKNIVDQFADLEKRIRLIPKLVIPCSRPSRVVYYRLYQVMRFVDIQGIC